MNYARSPTATNNNMRTTLAIILLWATATIALCVVGLVVTAKILFASETNEPDPVASLKKMLAKDAIAAFQNNGPGGLKTYLSKLDENVPGQRFLLDANSHDVLDGSNRADWIPTGKYEDYQSGTLPDGRFITSIKIADQPYRFLWVVQPWFKPFDPKPFIAVIATILIFMTTLLALYISNPLRRLRAVMDRFGHGDLSARINSKRPDEIGMVSRDFDLLANRIETLVTSERRLLQDVSHELRSPLTRLEVAIDLAMQEPDRPPMLDRIRKDVLRLSSLVRQVLELSHTEAEPLVNYQEHVSLEALITDVIADCEIEAKAKDCKILFESTWNGQLVADPELIRRAIENIVRNAIRHSPSNTDIKVNLKLISESVHITVRDQGPGVPSEALTKIFNPFYRVEGHRSRDTGGVGLGLAIARRAVELHGGTIIANNTPPGLTVDITLP